MHTFWTALKQRCVASRSAAPAAPQWRIEHRDRCTIYSGQYCLFNQSGRIVVRVYGRIVEWPGLPADVYVYGPPPALKRHPHGACLQLLSPGRAWFKLHWERPPRDFDSGRAYVEGLLEEALQVGH